MAQYTVQRGDTLTKIAQKLSGVSGAGTYGYVQALISINSIADKNKIYPGQVFNYPDEWSVSNQRRPVTINVPQLTPFGKQPLWKNPLMIGAAVIIGLIFMTKK